MKGARDHVRASNPGMPPPQVEAALDEPLAAERRAAEEQEVRRRLLGFSNHCTLPNPCVQLA